MARARNYTHAAWQVNALLRAIGGSRRVRAARSTERVEAARGGARLGAFRPAITVRLGRQVSCFLAEIGATGEMPEWSNGAVSKTVVLVTVPRVRIPLSPPLPV